MKHRSWCTSNFSWTFAPVNYLSHVSLMLPSKFHSHNWFSSVLYFFRDEYVDLNVCSDQLVHYTCENGEWTLDANQDNSPLQCSKACNQKANIFKITQLCLAWNFSSPCFCLDEMIGNQQKYVCTKQCHCSERNEICVKAIGLFDDEEGKGLCN